MITHVTVPWCCRLLLLVIAVECLCRHASRARAAGALLLILTLAVAALLRRHAILAPPLCRGCTAPDGCLQPR